MMMLGGGFGSDLRFSRPLAACQMMKLPPAAIFFHANIAIFGELSPELRFSFPVDSSTKKNLFPPLPLLRQGLPSSSVTSPSSTSLFP